MMHWEKDRKDVNADQWMKYHQVTVLTSRKRTVDVKLTSPHFHDPKNADYVTQIPKKKQETLVLEIPVEKIADIIRMYEWTKRNVGGDSPYGALEKMVSTKMAEKELRMSHPTVQAAWEQYSMILNLAANEKIDLDRPYKLDK